MRNIVEFPKAGLGSLKTINCELNGAIYTSEAATEAGRATVKICQNIELLYFRE